MTQYLTSHTKKNKTKQKSKHISSQCTKGRNLLLHLCWYGVNSLIQRSGQTDQVCRKEDNLVMAYMLAYTKPTTILILPPQQENKVRRKKLSACELKSQFKTYGDYYFFKWKIETIKLFFSFLSLLPMD